MVLVFSANYVQGEAQEHLNLLWNGKKSLETAIFQVSISVIEHEILFFIPRDPYTHMSNRLKKCEEPDIPDWY